MRAHHRSQKRPISQEAGEFQRLVGIMAAISLLMPTGPVRVTEALDLCSGSFRKPTSHSAFLNPQPSLVPPSAISGQAQRCPTRVPFPFCLSKHSHCSWHILHMPVSVLCSCLWVGVPTPLVWGRGSDSMCQKQALPGGLPSAAWENWGN